MQLFKTYRPESTLRVYQCVFPVFMFIHGLVRLCNGRVDSFGNFLNTKGLIVGVGVAWIVTLTEIVGSILIVVGKYVQIICVLLICQLVVGIVMIHLESGWYVVGHSTGGIEFSVSLIVGYLLLAFSDTRLKKQ